MKKIKKEINLQTKQAFLGYFTSFIYSVLTATAILMTIIPFAFANNKTLREELIKLEQAKKWKIAYSNGSSLYFLSMNGESRNIFKTKPTSLYGLVYPSLSPDGEKIAFMHNEKDNFNHYSDCLLVSNIDGSHQRKLIEARGIGNIAWSPDGKSIAYLQSEWTNNKVIWSLKTISLQGNIKTLTRDVYFLSSLSWSLDSQGIVFTSQDGLVSIIYIDSGKLKKIVKGDFVSWSPTGKIVYRDYEGDKPYWREYHNERSFTDYYAQGHQFYSVNADGTNKELLLDVKKKLKSMFDFLTDPKLDSPIIWSPDGKFVVFCRSYVRFPSYETKIYIMEVETKQIINISTVNQICGSLSWIGRK